MTGKWDQIAQRPASAEIDEITLRSTLRDQIGTGERRGEHYRRCSLNHRRNADDLRIFGLTTCESELVNRKSSSPAKAAFNF